MSPHRDWLREIEALNGRAVVAICTARGGWKAWAGPTDCKVPPTPEEAARMVYVTAGSLPEVCRRLCDAYPPEEPRAHA